MFLFFCLCMKQFFSSLLGSMIVFGLVEILFVLFIFHEIHIGDFATLSGVLHLSYWLVVLGCGWLRTRWSNVLFKAICTWFPIVYHVLLHVVMAGYLVHTHHDGHDHSLMMLIVLSIISLGLVFAWEYVIHRRWHCVTHHDHAHVHCHDSECTDSHQF